MFLTQKWKRSNQSRGTTGASICRRGIKILTGIRGQHSCRSHCEMTKPGEGEGRRSVSCSHHSRLTSTNRYTTCGDSIRKPLATDRLWANSSLGGVQKREGSVYKDKITQWNPSTCSTQVTRTGGCLTWHRGGQALLELKVWFQANKWANAGKKRHWTPQATTNMAMLCYHSHIFTTREDKYVDGLFIYEQKNVWASHFLTNTVQKRGRIAWTGEFLLHTSTHKWIKRQDYEIFHRYLRLTTAECEGGAGAARLESTAWCLHRGNLKALLTQALLQVAMESKQLRSGGVRLDLNNNCNLIK